jgi:hypothetical protein
MQVQALPELAVRRPAELPRLKMSFFVSFLDKQKRIE